MKKVLIINNEKAKDNLGSAPRIEQTLLQDKDISLEILHYTDLTKEKVEEINPDLIYLTGRLTYVEDLEDTLPEFAAEFELIRQSDIPILGVCAGHQLIALAYGGDIGRMVEVPEGEEDIKEKGFVKIEIRQQDLIFKGIEDPFLAYQWHRDEVKVMPDQFDLLASSEMCEVQVIKHREKNIYGIQFHPERYDEIHPAGKMILENFFDQVTP